MNIFNDNQKLEEVAMYGLDWGVFLRHNLDGPIMPFMYLFDGEKVLTRVLMTDDDPIEYAKQVLASEESPFQQFVIGLEGYLQGKNEQKLNAIIVQAFDKTQEKGVMLGQIFEPLEQNGTFEKVERVNFLGHPELLLPLEESEAPDYSVVDPGFQAIALKAGHDLVNYQVVVSHSNPSVIANTIRHFLRSKLAGEDSASIKGLFEFQITPGNGGSADFLKFLTSSAVNEERDSEYGLTWEENTGRHILVNCKLGDTEIITEFDQSGAAVTGVEETPEQLKEVPKLPVHSAPAPQPTDSKPWWKFW